MTEERQLFPSFCPADFEDARKAAQTALRLAKKAVADEPSSLVSLPAGLHGMSATLMQHIEEVKA